MGTSAVLGLSGAVSAQSGWPNPSDGYYSLLASDLEAALPDTYPAPEFVHADTESGTFGDYWASSDNFDGTASSLDVSGEGVPFSEAIRFDINTAPANNYDAAFRTGINNTDYRAVSAGQVLLGVAYLRAPDGSGDVQYVAENSQSATWNSVTAGDYQTVGSTWTRYYFPIKYDAAAAAGEWFTQFQMGMAAQRIDIGGVALLDFGTSADVTQLPRGAASNDPYYDSLLVDVDGMGLPRPEFVHASTESGTFSEYWASTTNFDGTASSLDVSGENVAFNQAIRFDINTKPANNYDAAFRTADFHSSEYRAISAGQVLLGVAYLRAPDGSGTAQYVAANSQSGTYNSVVSDDYQNLDGTWTRYYFPIEYDAAATWDQWYTQIQMGFAAQRVDIGGLALLDFGTSVDVANLPSGAAGEGGASGDLYEAWPDVGDPYYNYLVESMKDQGLPPAEFVHANSELGTMEEYWENSYEFDGSVDRIDVRNEGVPFDEAKRFTINESSENPWDVQYRTATWHSRAYRSIEAGQVMLGVAYLRAPEGSATVQYVADNGNSDTTWNFVQSDFYQGSLTTEWQRYCFPIEFDAAADWSSWSTQFQLGFGPQTIDIGGVALLDFNTGADVNSLPSGAASTGPYYESLLADVVERGLPLPEPRYADTEAGTLSTYYTNTTGSSTIGDLDVSDDPVPFANAKRVEIDQQPANAYEVQLRADVSSDDVATGDVLLGVAHMRVTEGEGAVQYLARGSSGSYANEVVNDSQPDLESEWQRFVFPIEFGKTESAGNWFTEINFGFAEQTVDVGGIALLDFGSSADVGSLPRWEAELADSGGRRRRRRELIEEEAREAGSDVGSGEAEPGGESGNGDGGSGNGGRGGGDPGEAGGSGDTSETDDGDGDTAGSDGTTDGDDDDSDGPTDDSIPGFGAVPGFAALAGAAGYALSRLEGETASESREE